MSNNSWTEEQLAAIDIRDCSLLVSAAAGAGKTAVLVERIIRRVCDEHRPVDVDRMLVVTFTKAAAAEMRERINGAVTRELNHHPQSRHLQRQLSLLNRAAITTLHSFCLDLLKKYFYTIGLDPGFRVADDAEAGLLQLEVLEELFEEQYAEGQADFLSLVDAYGGERDDRMLQEMVLKLTEFAVSNPWPQGWLQGLIGLYDISDRLPREVHPYFSTVLEAALFDLYRCRDMIGQALRLADAPGGPAAYRRNLQADLPVIEDLIRAGTSSWSSLSACLREAGFGRLAVCRGEEIDERLKNRVKEIRDEVKKRVNKIRDDFFSRDEQDFAADLQKAAGMVGRLAGLTEQFLDRYRKAKAERGLVDFADLEHLALKILTDPAAPAGSAVPSPVAEELKAYYCEVLVDEYQDINEVQETILRLVSRSEGRQANLFLVGDAKQSIYRFRLADPTLFLEKYRDFPRAPGGEQRCVDLTCNFRSRSEVVESVNFVFRQLMTGEAGEIEYDHKAELVSGADFPDLPEDGSGVGPTELHLLESSIPVSNMGAEAAEEEENEGFDALRREARAVAFRIKGMVWGQEGKGAEFLVFDRATGGYRPVQFRDIVILLRTTRTLSGTFLDELRELGIPAYTDLGTGYFETVEVETVLALLQVIDNPRQDIPLAAVLRSPVAGFSAEDLARTRLCGDGDLYAALLAAKTGDGPLAGRIGPFLENLEKWRTLARRHPLADLIWQLYQETGYYAFVGGMPGGAERQANLRSLHERARQFERTSFRGLFSFLRFITRFREAGSDLGTAGTVGENENAVRIMSIHKSKGLEFPVVIVAGLGKPFNLTDLNRKIVIHRKLGLGLPVVDPDLRLSYPTLAQAAIKHRLHQEMLAEELRVLYVAMTRAREKLVLYGSVRDLSNKVVEWRERSSAGKPWPAYAIVAARSFLDWIGPAAIQDAGWAVHLPDSEEERTGMADGGPVEGSWSGVLNRVFDLKPVDLSQGFDQIIADRLRWQYRWAKTVGRAAKASVTEVKGHFALPAGEAEEFYPAGESDFAQVSTGFYKRPGFITRQTELSPAERGLAMHRVMQHIRPHQGLTPEEVMEQVQDMLARELLTEAEAGSIEPAEVAGFFASALGRRYLAAGNVRTEVPFTLALPAADLYGDDPELAEEKVLVQGIIDCLVDEGDGYLLIDYKTDRADGPHRDEVVRRYRGQLNLYARAVQVLLRKPVKEKYLYLFSAGQAVCCD